MAGGASVRDIVNVEKGVKGAILIWRGDTDLPSGWTVRPVYGLDHSKDKSLFKSPCGDIYVGTQILKILDDKKVEESVSTTVVDNTTVCVATLDATLAAMLEPIVDLKELSITEWNNSNEFSSAISSVFGSFNQTIPTVHDDDSDAISLSDDEVEEIFENQSHSIMNISKANVTNACSNVNGKEVNVSEQQLEILEMAYGQWPDPFDKLVDELSKETNLKVEDVKNWFHVKTSNQITQAILKAENCQ